MQVNKDTDVAASLGLGESGPRAGGPGRWLVASLVIMVLAGAALLWLALDNQGAAQYSTAVLQRGDLTVTVTATGSVQPTNEVEISSELSGIIRTVAVDYNDRVEVGQVLAELDTDKLKAEVAHSRATLLARQASVQEAEARVTEKQSEYERIKRLHGGSGASQQQLEEAAAARDAATRGGSVANSPVSRRRMSSLGSRTLAVRSKFRGSLLRSQRILGPIDWALNRVPDSS